MALTSRCSNQEMRVWILRGITYLVHSVGLFGEPNWGLDGWRRVAVVTDWPYEVAPHAVVAQIVIWGPRLVCAWESTLSISQAQGFGTTSKRSISSPRHSAVEDDGEGDRVASQVTKILLCLLCMLWLRGSTNSVSNGFKHHSPLVEGQCECVFYGSLVLVLGGKESILDKERSGYRAFQQPLVPVQLWKFRWGLIWVVHWGFCGDYNWTLFVDLEWG